MSNREWGKCPIPGCGAELVMSISYLVDISDVTITFREPVNLSGCYFETSCVNGHIVDSGGGDGDGRSLEAGYRTAQILSGLR